MYFPLFVVVLCLSFLCCALLCVLSSFAIIMKRKRELVALLLLSYFLAFFLYCNTPSRGLRAGGMRLKATVQKVYGKKEMNKIW